MSVATLPSFCTYGRSLALRDLGGVAISIGAHAPNDTVPTHRHADEYQWCFTLDGEFEERAGSRREKCGSGSLLIRPPDCVHSDSFAAAPGLCLNLFPRRAWLAKHELSVLADTYDHRRSKRLQRLGNEVSLELRRADATTGSIELLVLELLESTARLTRFEADNKPRWLAEVLDEIEADPSAELNLAALALNAGVSAGHLARTFRVSVGKSAGEYVRGRRLHRATVLLQSPMKLADIASSVGFCDQAHFSRAFKSEFGLTPAAYRKQLVT
jgi:AraC family transcriptional regulator